MAARLQAEATAICASFAGELAAWGQELRTVSPCVRLRVYGILKSLVSCLQQLPVTRCQTMLFASVRQSVRSGTLDSSVWWDDLSREWRAGVLGLTTRCRCNDL